jgi:hypothetical protein
MTTPVGTRAVINGVETTLDEFRGKAYIQEDLRVSRPFSIHERWSVTPFVEFFNLFNRNNPGAFYITDISAFAHAGEQSCQRHGFLPEPVLHANPANHQPEPVALSRRSAG